MTTEFSRNQSPRLPANYPEHLERVLSKNNTRDRRLLVPVVLLGALGVAILAYGLLSA